MTTARKQVALEVLRCKCSDIESLEEANVIIRLLEYVAKDYPGECLTVTAPELNVMKKVAIIRTPDIEIDLVNPKIIAKSGDIISFKENCFSFSESLNCRRYNKITLQNGFDSKETVLTGNSAILVQHAVDHLGGLLYFDKTIKLAIIRNHGKILPKDFCPCGSQERFTKCCM